MAQDLSDFYRGQADRLVEIAAYAQDQKIRLELLEMAARFRETAFAMNAANRHRSAANANIDQRAAIESA